MDKDETPIGAFGRRVWAAVKEYGLVFLAGCGAGVGVTLAVQHVQSQQEQEVVHEEGELRL